MGAESTGSWAAAIAGDALRPTVSPGYRDLVMSEDVLTSITDTPASRLDDVLPWSRAAAARAPPKAAYPWPRPDGDHSCADLFGTTRLPCPVKGQPRMGL
jgi:hypothetical protein